MRKAIKKTGTANNGSTFKDNGKGFMKTVRMKRSTAALLKKVANRIDEQQDGLYTQGDAVREGLILLAKKKKIEI